MKLSEKAVSTTDSTVKKMFRLFTWMYSITLKFSLVNNYNTQIFDYFVYTSFIISMPNRIFNDMHHFTLATGKISNDTYYMYEILQ